MFIGVLTARLRGVLTMILSGTLTVILNGVLSELAGFLPENVPEGVSYRTEDEQRPAESGQGPSDQTGAPTSSFVRAKDHTLAQSRSARNRIRSVREASSPDKPSTQNT